MRTIKNLLLVAALFISTIGFAQKKFTEGTIVYEVETNREELGMAAQMIPKEVVVKVKGDMVRTDQESAMMSNSILFNTKEKKATTLMDIMGNKYAIDMDDNAIKEQMDKMPTFEIKTTDETKEIAGYKCKKIIVINKDNSDEMIVYYTESIPNFSSGDMMSTMSGLSQIKGFPMEYSMKMQGISMTMRVKSITIEKIADEVFAVPADYKKTTIEDLQKELGGGQ